MRDVRVDRSDERTRVAGSIVRTLVAGTLLVAVAATTACRLVRVSETGTESEESPALREQVAEMLDASAAAWNRGDLEAFMADYERSPGTTYIGSSGLLVGWEAIRDRYAPAFAPGAERDSLRFEGLRVRELGQRHALATARYVLEREGAVTGSGPFTLVLLRVEGSWSIIHDHSSSDPPEAEAADADAASAADADAASATGS